MYHKYCISFFGVEDQQFVLSVVIKATSREKAYDKFVKWSEKHNLIMNLSCDHFYYNIEQV